MWTTLPFAPAAHVLRDAPHSIGCRNRFLASSEQSGPKRPRLDPVVAIFVLPLDHILHVESVSGCNASELLPHHGRTQPVQ